jgi:hypothetical protein
MRDDDRTSKPADGHDDANDLDALVGETLARRGELPPITEAEVLAAERAGVEDELGLPPGLAQFRGEIAQNRLPEGPSSRAQAAPARVIPIASARPSIAARVATHGLALALGAAAAALLIVDRGAVDRAQPGGDTSSAPPPSPSASAPPSPSPIAIAAVRGCDDCCAGSSCAKAEGENRACATGRACVPCDEGQARDALYRVRVGNVVPTAAHRDDRLDELDLCGRVVGGPWACEPAYLDAALRPRGRSFDALVSPADLAAGFELELRPRGQAKSLAGWRDAVRVGPGVVCRGVGVLLASAGGDHFGSVSLVLDDAHFVEIGARGAIDAVKNLRNAIAFSDVVPSIVELASDGAPAFALAVGPLDRRSAERLRWALLDRSVPARVTLGEDHRGPGKPLP